MYGLKCAIWVCQRFQLKKKYSNGERWNAEQKSFDLENECFQ